MSEAEKRDAENGPGTLPKKKKKRSMWDSKPAESTVTASATPIVAAAPAAPIVAAAPTAPIVTAAPAAPIVTTAPASAAAPVHVPLSPPGANSLLPKPSAVLPTPTPVLSSSVLPNPTPFTATTPQQILPMNSALSKIGGSVLPTPTSAAGVTLSQPSSTGSLLGHTPFQSLPVPLNLPQVPGANGFPMMHNPAAVVAAVAASISKNTTFPVNRLPAELEAKILKAKIYARSLQQVPYVLQSSNIHFTPGETPQGLPLPAGLPSIPGLPTGITLPSLEQLTKNQEEAKQTRALQLMSRIYVGSINFDLGEEDVRTVFETCGPIHNVDIQIDPMTQKHKGFCFLEFKIPEAAVIATTSLGAVSLGGRQLKVGLPSNAPTSAPVMEEIKTKAESYARIYVACINTELTAEDVQSVFEAFGPIKDCKLGYDIGVPDHLGYGYIEYESIESCEEAVVNMNNFDLGGALLKVCRAVTPPIADLLGTAKGSPDNGEDNAALETSGDTENPEPKPKSKAEEKSLQQEDDFQISSVGEQFLLMQKLSRNSGVIVLRNMVSIQDVDDLLEGEIREECLKFGVVEDCVIHTEPDSFTKEPIVKIFVKFNKPEQADKAKESLHNRWFGGRQTIAETYDAHKFDTKDYSG